MTPGRTAPTRRPPVVSPGWVGSSGSSMFPHLHCELRSGAGLNVEGLPAYFHGFRRLLGSRSTEVRVGPVDSGDFLQGTAPVP
ncbi:MAG TPA: hypothetical protein VF615_01910 [Longimicrobiaceae bacterium]